MRILHITTFLQGGAGRNITDLAIAQRQAGHDVLVAADAGGAPGYGSYPEYITELRGAGVALAYLTSTFKRSPALNARAALELRAQTGGWNPDVVHAHATTPAVVARLAGLSGNGRLLNTMHGWGITKTPEQAEADVAVLELADAVVVPSSSAARTLSRAGLRRADVRVIPYGIADNVPSSLAADAGIRGGHSNGSRTCLCIGTIGERKNQRLLVDALATETLQNVGAVFIGDGDVEALREYAAHRGVASRVTILGHRPHASRYLAIADALVLPSRNEGLPLAVLESLRAGVPVVAADIPEIAEALDDGRCGYLFVPEDATSLAGAVLRSFDTSPAFREAMRARFARHYSAGRMLDAYADLYRGLTAA
jgi:glycosyltransferase involved in cell wall biosynthesis